MSGGVDSSVAACLLHERGYRVLGSHLELVAHGGVEHGCCGPQAEADAAEVARIAGFDFEVVNMADRFSRTVLADFFDEHRRGRTPNPCVRCNQFVKFGNFWDRARQLGGDWVATGHYARVARRDDGSAELWRGADDSKDQSYFLFALTPDVLRHCLFPVGDLRKRDVRAIAERLHLPVAAKPESQEVCFAPRREYVAFVGKRAAQTINGDIVDADGRVLGRHDGIHQFTIGQRRGLGLGGGEPRYVTAIDPDRGEVRVGPRDANAAGGLVARDVIWTGGAAPARDALLQIKIRSRFAPTPVRVETVSADRFTVAAPTGLVAVTPGQAAVLYDGDRVVGGGWIERATPRIAAAA